MAMTNAEWLVKNKYDFGSIYLVDKHEGLFKIMYQNGSNCIGEAVSTTSAGALIVWLSAEHKEPILDDAEKQYLSAVIKPFRNEKLEIVKYSACNGSEEWLNFVRENGSFYLPNFKTGTMYKGMKQGKHYTLEELGL